MKPVGEKRPGPALDQPQVPPLRRADDVPAVLDGEQEAKDAAPKFGRLLMVLLLAVMLIGALSLGAESYYS